MKGVKRLDNLEKQVILIEDQPLVRNILINLLEVDGFRVFEAEDISEGMSLYNQFPSSYMIIDDGEDPRYELHKKVLQVNPNARVIRVSGNLKDRNPPGEIRHYNFLQKPFTLDDLRSKMDYLRETG